VYYLRNTEARFGNQCYDGKAVSIIQPECASVALGIQYAMRMRHIHICGIPHPKTYFIHSMIFEKKKNVTELKMYVWVSSKTFV